MEKKSQMFCGLALKRIELPSGPFFMFFFYSQDFRIFLRAFFFFFSPQKNTLVIVTGGSFIHCVYNSRLPEGNAF